MGPKDIAHQRIANLRAGSGPGAWTHLHRTRVADELDVRVDDPTKIYQGQVGLCAPSAFLEDLVTDDPVHYARMAHELFELGFTHMVRAPHPAPAECSSSRTRNCALIRSRLTKAARIRSYPKPIG